MISVRSTVSPASRAHWLVETVGLGDVAEGIGTDAPQPAIRSVTATRVGQRLPTLHLPARTTAIANEPSSMPSGRVGQRREVTTLRLSHSIPTTASGTRLPVFPSEFVREVVAQVPPHVLGAASGSSQGHPFRLPAASVIPETGAS